MNAEISPMVFVIDDEPTIQRGLARLMRATGLSCEVFGSARGFLETVVPDRPSCIVLDIRMPGLSGLELQDRLSLREASPPIVFITGYADVSMSVLAMKAGAFDFLEKPFDDHQLLDAIHRAIEVHRTEREGLAIKQDILRRVARLTPRERQVMELVVVGFLNKQIGGRLGTSEKTVKVHRGRMMRKMEAGSVAELVHLTERVSILGP